MPISTPSSPVITGLNDSAFDAGSIDFLHRFDSPHQRPNEFLNGHLASDSDTTSTKDTVKDLESNEVSEFDPAAMRNAHADDLIEFLQRWSEELDERAARLHANMATHERRERAFRLWMQNRRSELETQIAEYKQAQARAETIARRIAVTG